MNLRNVSVASFLREEVLKRGGNPVGMLPSPPEPLLAGFPAPGGKILLGSAPLDFFDIPAEPAGLSVAVCLALKGGSPGFFLFEGNELLTPFRKDSISSVPVFSCRIDHFFWP
jgi:hypothetical protein